MIFINLKIQASKYKKPILQSKNFLLTPRICFILTVTHTVTAPLPNLLQEKMKNYKT